MIQWLKRLWQRPKNLWYNVVTGRYHDPRVLMRSLCELPEPLQMPDIRRLLLMVTPVTPDGRGYSESQVEDAYNAFLEWHEGKEKTVRSSPTSAPSTGCPTT